MRREPPRPEMNVTPLVDIVLVLLIIFMVITPQMEAGASVTIPGIKNVDGESKTKLEPITLSLTASGQLYLEKDPVTRETLMASLKDLHASSPERRLLLKGDRAVRYLEMRNLFVSVQEVGFPGIALQVGDKAKEQPAEKQE